MPRSKRFAAPAVTRPTAKLMLVPEAWQNSHDLPAAHRDMYAYYASMMEPWDGPAALAMTDGRWVVAGVDRNALRPLRTTQTADNLLIVGSETGMVVVPESTIIRKGRIGPGGMIAVDLDKGRLYEDGAIKDRISGEHPFGDYVSGFRSMADLAVPSGEHRPVWTRAELIRRQVAAGLTLEDMELILAPYVEDAKEAIGSMGDDTPLAVISDKPRLISHFFRQNFSQVTNPPIDSLRETRVMSLTTRFGNLGNILDTEARQNGVLVLDSPVLDCAGWATLKAYFGAQAAEIDCTFVAEGPDALRQAIAAIRAQAEQAVREGRTELFLTDEAVGNGARRHPDGARGGRGAHASGAQGSALLLVDQRAFGGVPRHALFRGAHRRRRGLP